jgi:hypothetical protein
VAPHGPRHDFHPFTILFTFEYFLDGLKDQAVGPLNYSIGLQVVYRCEGDLRPGLMVEILEQGTAKILDIIDRDLLWNSIEIDDVLPEEFLNGSRGYVGVRLHFNTFGEVLHCNYSKSVVFLCWCKFIDNIDTPSWQELGWGNQLRRLRGSLGAMGEFLTVIAG